MKYELDVSVFARLTRDKKEKMEIQKEKEAVLKEPDFLDSVNSLDIKTNEKTFNENLKKKKILNENDDYEILDLDMPMFFKIPDKHSRFFFIESIKKFYSIEYELNEIKNIPLEDMCRIIDNIELTEDFKCPANEKALENLKGMLEEDIERLEDEMFEYYIQDIPGKSEVLFNIKFS